MRALGLAALALAALSQPALATKSARAVRAEPAPEIDGVLDDPVWQGAVWIDDFAQSEPFEGAPPSRRTEVAFAYDDRTLYVGARMFADGPADVEAVMTRRDDAGNAERIIVSFDTFADRRTAYSFAVTAAGVRVDWFHPDDNAHRRDASFDPVWQARTQVGPTGWTAEMRIPFSQLRFPAGEQQTWGVNINRYMPQDREDVFWTLVPRNAIGWSSYFGELQGLERVATPRRLELLPYLAGDATLTSASLLDPDDPFADRLDFGVRAGGDLKLGLGSSLTLDATVNPDFGQVEADPAEVNLSAFETSFAERRPFFTEGAELLAGNGPSYFYSRRIGAPPRGDPGADPRADIDGDGQPDIDYAAADDFTRILGQAHRPGRPRHLDRRAGRPHRPGRRRPRARRHARAGADRARRQLRGAPRPARARPRRVADRRLGHRDAAVHGRRRAARRPARAVRRGRRRRLAAAVFRRRLGATRLPRRQRGQR
jgi:hypothetical protein